MLLTSRLLRPRSLSTAFAVALLSAGVVPAQTSSSQAARPSPPPHVTPPPHPEPVHSEPHPVSHPEPAPITSPGRTEPITTAPSESHPTESNSPADRASSLSSGSSSSATSHAGSHHNYPVSSSSSSSSMHGISSRSTSGSSTSPRIVGRNGMITRGNPSTPLPPYCLTDLNTARQKMPGINQHPLPAGNLAQSSSGDFQLTASGRRHYTLAADGKLKFYSGPDAALRFRGDGSLTQLRSPSLDFTRAANGNRKVTWRPDADTRVVSFGAHRGYVEHTIHQNGKAYLQRIYTNRNKSDTRTFVRYHARSMTLAYYPPRSFYPPGFYSWNYQPWPNNVHWTWRWQSYPWYRSYGAFFLFSGFYNGPTSWLADFILGETADEDAPDSAQPQDALTPDAASYGPGATDANGDPSPIESQADAPITEPEKAALVSEVRTDVQQNGDIAADPTRTAAVLNIVNNLVPGYVLVVDDPLYANIFTTDVITSLPADGGNTNNVCLLSPGDLITVTRMPSIPQNVRSSRGDGLPATFYPSVQLEVTASRKRDCPVQTKVRIPIDRLQDMDNNFRARLDDGMAVLYDINGKQGLPTAPHDATALLPVTNASLPAPVDATTAPQQINQAQIEATRLQQQLETSALAINVADSTSLPAAAAQRTTVAPQ